MSFKAKNWEHIANGILKLDPSSCTKYICIYKYLNLCEYIQSRLRPLTIGNQDMIRVILFESLYIIQIAYCFDVSVTV